MRQIKFEKGDRGADKAALQEALEDIPGVVVKEEGVRVDRALQAHSKRLAVRRIREATTVPNPPGWCRKGPLTPAALFNFQIEQLSGSTGSAP